MEGKRQARLAKEAEKQEKERLKMLAREQAAAVAKEKADAIAAKEAVIAAKAADKEDSYVSCHRKKGLL